MTSNTPRANFGIRHSRANSGRDGEAVGLAPSLMSDKGDGRSLGISSAFGPRTASLANSVAPGSLTSNLKTTNGLRSVLRPDIATYGPTEARPDDATASERRQAEYRDRISKEQKIKHGSENLLEALLAKNPKQTKDQRARVESELASSNRKITELQNQLQAEIERSKQTSTPARGHLSTLFQDGALSAVATQKQEDSEYQDGDGGQDTASPTFVLSELLQALEAEDMDPEYYVLRANALAELFTRNPTLKYKLAWSIFGLRIQTMLLSESREVVAAGYRVTRHAFADQKSLQTVRALNTDMLVVLSLARGQKLTIEREQTIKFVRAFLQVKGGVQEVSNAVIKALIAVAEPHEHQLDRGKNIAILTLAEILIQDPIRLARAGGMVTLASALEDGSYPGSESLAAAFLFLTDAPRYRKLLFVGQELAGPFGLFSDTVFIDAPGNEERLKTAGRAISTILNSWPGLFSQSYAGFASVASLLMSLYHPSPTSRNILIDLVFDLLNIKPPAWTSSFLAGRRLTTYGKVATLREDPNEHLARLENEDDFNRANLTDHYTALMLLILIKCGLVETLSELVREEMEDEPLHRKTVLLLSEVLKLADHSLPRSISAKLQILNDIMQDNETFDKRVDKNIPHNVAFQLDTVSRTLYRTAGENAKGENFSSRSRSNSANLPQPPKIELTKYPYDMDELRFRLVMGESQVVNHSGYHKWNFSVIHDIVEGPLRNPKRLEEAKTSKFLKRLLAFYRPFKYRFSDARNTKPNQRFVRTGVALIKCLLSTPDGVQVLAEEKLVRQLAECLAQLDRMSGITSDAPMFSPDRVANTMVHGYFAILGALSSDPQGLKILERARMITMFYHILELQDREDVVRILLEHMDFTIDSHLRVMLSKSMTNAPKSIRTFATKMLRKYTTQEIETTSANIGIASDAACWAIKLLVTQLYDPDVEVSEVAVQILQEACNRKQYLEYVVKCQPALDHLGEIGAPLLLRFLSTSLGYEYLHRLDYIIQEMDDWFLGRNEKYVALVETAIHRGFSHETGSKQTAETTEERQQLGIVPPHFYRELTRTEEGCQLLKESGHFEEFVSTIKDFWSVEDDPETMLKVKGSLWAVGNVCSMELGAYFLESFGVLDWIIKIVEKSRVMSMRGTAFFVLGLISRSSHGFEILAERGWDAATDDMGQSLGYILPPDLAILFPSDRSEHHIQRRPAPLVTLTDAPPPENEDNPLEERLYTTIVEAGNSVMKPRVLKDLNTLKEKAPQLFKSVPIFRRAMHLLECHIVQRDLRSRVIDLFDKDVLRRLVLNDNEEEEQSTDSDEENDNRAEDSGDEGKEKEDDGEEEEDGNEDEEEAEEEEEEDNDDDDDDDETSGTGHSSET